MAPRSCTRRHPASFCMSLRGAKRRGNPLLLAVGQNEKQYFGRIRKALRICHGSTFLHTQTPGKFLHVIASLHPRTPAHLLHVIARSEATWQSASPCSGAEREAILWANTKSITNLPEQQSACQVFLRGNGLPHQCAHWFAMTCRRKRRCCGCKNVGRNDMQKAETLLRVQRRFPQWTGAARCNITFTFSPMPPTQPFTLA